MKKIVSNLLQFCIFAFLVFALIILFSMAPDSFRQGFFSKVPFLKSFINVDTNKTVTEIQRKSVQKLKTAQFDMDFLVEMDNGKGKFLALYPYRVVAGIDFEDIKYKETETEVIIDMPEPEIFFSGTANNSDTLILRDTLKGDSGNYDSYFKGLLIAFEKKAKDLALAHGILESCENKNLEVLNQFGRVLPNDKKIVLKTANFEKNMENNCAETSLKNVPLSFNLSSFNDKNIFVKDEIIPSRDGGKIFLEEEPLFYIGFNGLQGENISFEKYVENYRRMLYKDSEFKNYTMVLISHPYDDSGLQSVLFADEGGYKKSLLMDKSGREFYIGGKKTSAQENLDFMSPLLVYGTLSAKAQDQIPENYQNYSSFKIHYDSILDSFTHGHYAVAKQVLAHVEERFGLSNDLKKLKSVIALLNDGILIKTEFDEVFDGNLEICQVLLKNKFKNFDSNARKLLLKEFSEDEKIRLKLKSLFLENLEELDLSIEEYSDYAADIIQTGKVISKRLFENLQPKQMCNYITNILTTKLTHDVENNFPRVEKHGETTFVLSDESSGSFFEDKKYGALWLKNELLKSLKESDDLSFWDNKVVLLYREEGFWINYTAIVFDEKSFIVFNNITAKFRKSEPITINYENIKWAENTVVFGDYEYENKSILPVFKELQQVFQQDNYYGINLTEDFVKKLRQEVINEMKLL